MPDFVDRLANALPDAAILVLFAVVFGFVGGTVSYLSNRLWFRHWPAHSPYEDRLADTAHTSLLGFSVFVLALLISNSFSALSKAEEAVRHEAIEVSRMARDLDALGQPAQDAKRALVAYAHDAAGDEWTRLARRPNSLSPLAQSDLNALWAVVRAIQLNTESASPNVRDELGGDLLRIETLRGSRLSAATDDVPDIFWLILLMFVIAASFLSGREAPKRFGMQINLIHMSAIGLAVGLVVVLSNPFRGDTSASPQIILDAL